VLLRSWLNVAGSGRSSFVDDSPFQIEENVGKPPYSNR
jgi:hypothetical protein